MAEKTPGFKTITKEEFDALARQPDLWSMMPELESRTKQYGDPYDPKREVRGILKDGRKIRAEV
jgi:CO dehydrogenase/acetyl-CoA synthase gamma subunit (corrinoid Fe-S protein)